MTGAKRDFEVTQGVNFDLVGLIWTASDYRLTKKSPHSQ